MMPQDQGILQQEQQQVIPPQGQPQVRDYNKNPPDDKDKTQFEKFEVNAIKLIHSEGMPEKIINMVNSTTSDKHPISKISDIAVMLMNRIEQAAEKSNDPVDDLIKIQGGNTIVGELINLLEVSKTIPATNEDEKTLILTQSVQKYTKQLVAQGKITKEELQKYANQAMSVGQKNGTLDMNKIRAGGKQQGKQQKAQGQGGLLNG